MATSKRRNSSDTSGRNSGKGSKKTSGRAGSKNLKPWKPGQSGNPSGRPRKALTLLRHAYIDVLGRPVAGDMKRYAAEMVAAGATWAEMIALAIANAAYKGDVTAATEIRKTTEGDTVKVNTGQQLKDMAEKLGLDENAVRSDPILAAIFAAAGVDGFGG